MKFLSSTTARVTAPPTSASSHCSRRTPVRKGGAVRHGILHGRGRRLLMVDADGASRIEDLELLCKAMDEISSSSGVAHFWSRRRELWAQIEAR
ncbi:hypothetical protein L226DRAFT_139549 [Lentinus tigrinus ALCF2SS1-7]|uniref:uncharacterized protein n=1 Tax=Lentinus tigrinus ALCF2SS1-7 TaxID=1328758 RepID=UPI001165F4CB|nr:hypothetical protein L226DRAFT_139549 [Lentinus tigrinus ALCF2SS1-7]